ELTARCPGVHAEIVNSDTYLVSPDLIRANSVSVKFFSDHWTRIEWLQRGWINSCAERYRRVFSLVKERQADLAYANNMPELRESYDLLYATVATLSNGKLSTNAKIQEAIARYKSGNITNLMVEGIAFADEQTSIDAEALQAFGSALEVALELWSLLEIDAE